MCTTKALAVQKSESFSDSNTTNSSIASESLSGTTPMNTTCTAMNANTNNNNNNNNQGGRISNNNNSIQNTNANNAHNNIQKNENENDPSSSPSSSMTIPTSNSITIKAIYTTILWIILTYTSKEFAKYLSIHQSQAAQQTFIPASYAYDDQDTYFDNTFLTYGTDYILCILMLYASFKCYSTKTGLGFKGCALYGSYAISVFCGGYAHSHFLDVESLNTVLFRIWWILCVGSVTAAGGFMGMCGSEICTFMNRSDVSDTNGRRVVFEKRFDLGNVRHSLWWYYGGFLTFICMMGEISYKRPACDIFVAGTTQFVPTVYVALTLLCMRWKDAIPVVEGHTTSNQYAYLAIPRKLRIAFYIGFFLNAPLLPSYPLLVQYTNLPLGVVNALMHANLTVAWGMQAWSTYQISLVMNEFKKGVEQDGGSVGIVGDGKKYL